MSKGYLIVFTGIDGSGKTTQVRLLVESLKQHGIEGSYVWSRWEPLFLRPLIKRWKSNVTKEMFELNHKADGIKDKKRKLLNNPIFRWLWLGSFLIDYGLQLFVKIRIGLLKKQLIISDRIFYDSVIDQMINLGKRKDWLFDSLDSFWMKILFPKPDMVVYIDCSEDIAFSRKNDAPDIEYLIERRELYLKLANKYKWIKINGALSVNEVAAQIKDKVYKRLEFF